VSLLKEQTVVDSSAFSRRLIQCFKTTTKVL